MTNITKFSFRLQQLAFRKKLIQADLASIFGQASSTISKWWNGQIIPGPKNLRIISDYFGCSYEWLKTGKGEIFPVEKTPTEVNIKETKDKSLNIAGDGNIQAGRNINGIAHAPLQKQRMEGFLDDDELELITMMREYGGKAMVKRFREEMLKVIELFNEKLNG